MVIVWNLLSQLKDAEEKSIMRQHDERIARMLTEPSENRRRQPQDDESIGEHNQMAPRPAVIRQSWIQPGNHCLFQLVLFH